MRYNWRWTLALLFGLLMVPIAAQNNDDTATTTCPAIVAEALATVDAACGNTTRGQACAATNGLTATDTTGASQLGTAGNTAALADLASITAARLDPTAGTWGLGLLTLQSDIPPTLPDINTRFLLVGDVVVESDPAAGETVTDFTPITVQTQFGTNLRERPSTNALVVGSIGPDLRLNGIGRNADATWVQVVFNNTQRAWVSAEVVRIEGDLNALPVTSATDIPRTPFGSVLLSTGGDAPPCDDAPPNHLLFSTPNELDVIFAINGVTFRASSAVAVVQRIDEVLTVSVFDGTVIVEAGGSAGIVQPGFAVDIPLAEQNGSLKAARAPQNFRRYDRETWTWYEVARSETLTLETLILPTEPVVFARQAQSTISPTGIVLENTEIQVTLVWDTLADMDIAVTDPLGDEVFYDRLSIPSGGQLDIDSNFPCGENTFETENIFWYNGTAPRGTYEVTVDLFDSCAAPNPNWILTVRVGERVVLQESGFGGERTFRFSY